MQTTFREVMAGQVRLSGEAGWRQMRLELAAKVPGLLTAWGDQQAAVAGWVHIDGHTDDHAATGTMRIAPVAARRIRYRVDFTAGDGRRLQLDGWKSVSPARPVRSMTVLPATITDAAGQAVGEARLSFDIRQALLPMLGSFRISADAAPSGPPELDHYLRPRWRGQPGRLEVWYTTLTDPATGTGVWLHHELVAPGDGGQPRAHGWAAVFPPDAPPAFARFGPEPWSDPGAGAAFAAGDVRLTATRSCGRAGRQAAAGDSGAGPTPGGISWDLAVANSGPPLFTFPRWAWNREVLPAAQIVAAPAAAFTGTISYGGVALPLDSAPGATARIYGHGNASRWAWLHAELGGGDVCEVVAAVPARPGLNRLRPVPFVRLRVDGTDWPSADPVLAAPRFIAKIGLPEWSVAGRVAGRRLRIRVSQPPQQTVTVRYANPDGSEALCRNSERATAVIDLQRRSGGSWLAERSWQLDGTAHAEVGSGA